MIELWMVTLLLGVLSGVLAVPVVTKIIEWKHKRDWKTAGKQWARTYERAIEAREFFGDLPPDDDIVEDIRGKVEESA